jgi:hypothetical protein
MSYLNTDVRRAYARLADRPIPRGWSAKQPVLSEHPTPASLVTAIRDDSDVERSDTVVRALAALAQAGTEDAAVVLLEALAREALRRAGTGSSSEFRDEILIDLTCVILDSGDLAGTDRLAERLTRRAHSRTARRNFMSHRRAATEVAIDAGLELLEPVPSVEGQVLARIQMEHVRDLLDAALASGELPDYVWQRFRDFRLAPLLGFDRPAFNRRRVHDHGIEVRQHLAHAS